MSIEKLFEIIELRVKNKSKNSYTNKLLKEIILALKTKKE